MGTKHQRGVKHGGILLGEKRMGKSNKFDSGISERKARKNRKEKSLRRKALKGRWGGGFGMGGTAKPSEEGGNSPKAVSRDSGRGRGRKKVLKKNALGIAGS